MPPLVAVCFGSVNRRPLLEKCVESIRRAAGTLTYKILVAYGASTDGTAEWLDEQSDCERLDGGTAGFARAMNAATARAVDLGVKAVAIFNDDAEFVDPDALGVAFSRLVDQPDLGAVEFILDRYRTRGLAWGWALYDGVPYCNMGLVRVEAGMAVARASGDPTGRRWFHDGYHTYWSDNEFGYWLHRLGYRIDLARDVRVHDEYGELAGPGGDALRKTNLSHITADGAVFKRRWSSGCAYSEPMARRFGGLIHETPPPSPSLIDRPGYTILYHHAPLVGAIHVPPQSWPTVSCLMVTHHGHEMAEDAIAQFRAQDYPGKIELVVLDNGEDRVGDLCEGDPRIVYHWEEGPPARSLGELRNDAHALSTGDITIEWDDDDARVPGFVTALVQGLLDNHEAHYSCMGGPFRIQVGASRANYVWNINGPHDGTLAIWRRHWEPFEVGRATGEKGAYVARRIEGRPAHPVALVPGQHLWVYRIHGHNNWALQPGTKGERLALVSLPPEMRATLPESDCGVVTISDAAYYPQLKLCLDSLMAVCPCVVKVLDIGLAPEQVAELSRRGIPTFKPPASAERFVEDKTACGSRYAWAKAFVLRDGPLWRRTLWLDSDTYVVKSLDPLFEMLKSRAVLTPELYTGVDCQNFEELYERAPVKARSEGLAINAGVMGFDRERDADIIDAWCGFVERCFAEPDLKPLVAWYDQGALIWAVQSIGRADAVLRESTWNCLADRTTRGGRRKYHADRLREEIAAAHPGAAIVHWAGREKLDALLLPAGAPHRPAPAPAPALAPARTRPRLRPHVHMRRH